MLETTHNTQRTTHNYSWAQFLTYAEGLQTGPAGWSLLSFMWGCHVCLWAEWPLAYFSTATNLYSICVSFQLWRRFRQFILLSRCFSKIIISLFFFLPHSLYEVLWTDFFFSCHSLVSLLQWSSINLWWILQISTLFWFIDYRWWHILHTCHVSTHIFFLLAVRRSVVTWPSPPSQQSHPA